MSPTPFDPAHGVDKWIEGAKYSNRTDSSIIATSNYGTAY